MPECVRLSASDAGSHGKRAVGAGTVSNGVCKAGEAGEQK
jgi:hypothetical protein